MSRPLNPKQLKFVERYLATGNATQSYVEAYEQPDRRAAEAGASRLLSNGKIATAVAEAKKAAVEKFPLTYEAALSNMWEQARWYGDDASHMARVKATERVMEHFRPQSGSTTNVNVAVLTDDELRRRIDALEGRTEPASGSQRLLAVASPAPAAVQLGVDAPQGNPPSSPEGDGRGE